MNTKAFTKLTHIQKQKLHKYHRHWQAEIYDTIEGHNKLKSKNSDKKKRLYKFKWKI